MDQIKLKCALCGRETTALRELHFDYDNGTAKINQQYDIYVYYPCGCQIENVIKGLAKQAEFLIDAMKGGKSGNK